MKPFWNPLTCSIILLGAIVLGGAARVLCEDSNHTSLGGLATGSLQIASDGTPRSLWLQGQEFSLDGSFLGVRTSVAGHVVAKAFTSNSDLGLPALGELAFAGHFPRTVHETVGTELPVTVRMETLVPFAPGDSEGSSLPVAFFVITMTNPGKRAVDASLLFSSVCPFPAQPNRTRSGELGLPQLVLTGDPRVGFQFTGAGFRSKNPSSFSFLTLDSEGVQVAGVPLLDGSTGSRQDLWKDFSLDGVVGNGTYQDVSQGVTGTVSRAGALSCSTRIAPGRSSKFSFALSWHDGRDAIKSRFADARSVAADALGRLSELREKTVAWQDLILHATAPMWLREQMLFQSGEMARAARWMDGDLTWLDGSTDLPQRLLAHPWILGFFPKIDAHDIRQLARTQLPTGEFPDPQRPHETPSTSRPDRAAAFAILVYRHVTSTGDQDFLGEMLPAVELGMRWTKSLDRDRDGIPEGTTWFNPTGEAGAHIGLAGLWMTALRCTERMARAEGNGDLASSCVGWNDQVRLATHSMLWNGSYFDHSFDGVGAVRDKSCRASQLFGDVLARSVGIPWIHEEHTVDSVLEQLLETNGSWVHDDPSIRKAVLLGTGIESGREKRSLAALAPIAKQSASTPGARHEPTSFFGLQGMTGFICEPDERRITFSLHPRSSLETSTYPIMNPHFWGEVQFATGPNAGDHHVQVDFSSMLSDQEFHVKEVRFGLPRGSGDSMVVRARSERGAEPGKASAGGRFLTFRFHEPMKISSGSWIRFHLAPRDSGRIYLGLEGQEIRSEGAVTKVATVRRESGGIVLELENPGPAAQHVCLYGDLGEWTNYGLFANSVAQPPLDGSEWKRGVSLWIEGSILTSEDFSELAFVNDAVSMASWEEGEVAADFLKSVRSFQLSVENFLAREKRTRTLRVDILPLGREPVLNNVQARWSREQAVGELRRLFSALSVLRKKAESPGPGHEKVLACLYPLELSVEYPEGFSLSRKFAVAVEVSDPFGYGLESRLSLEGPPGFEVAETSVAASESGQVTTYEVTPLGSGENRRQFMTARIDLKKAGLPFSQETKTWFGSGALRSWQVIGPFARNGSAGFSTIYPPESEVSFTSTYAGESGPVRWKPAEFSDGHVHLSAALSTGADSLGYALCAVQVEVDTEFFFEVMSSGRLQLSVNGVGVLEESSATGSRRPIREAATLRAGWNTLLLKAESGARISVEMTDASGQSLTGIRVTNRLGTAKN